MRTWGVFAVGAAIAALLVVASLAGASSPMKRYTLPAGPQSIVSPGKLTVLLPAGWVVTTWAKYGSSGVDDPAHRASGNFLNGVRWNVTSRLMPTGTTLDDIRQEGSFHGPRDVYGSGVVIHQVGDTFLDLPIGKVWRQSLLAVPPKGGWAARGILRSYWLDRGVVHDAKSGAEKQLFSMFRVSCRHQWCAAHNRQFEAIMRSIRLTTG